MSEITIVGGGFSGLILAYAMTKVGVRPTVIEASARFGGVIQTLHSPFGPVECAANGMINTPMVQELFSDLNLKMVPNSTSGKTERSPIRWIARDQMRRFPVKITEGLRVIKALLQYRFQSPNFRPRALESLADWGERTLGKSLTEGVLEPAFQGVYGARAKHLSASLVLSFLFEAQGQKKLRVTPSGTVAPAGGMNELIDGLVIWLLRHGATLHLNQLAPARLTSDQNVVWTISPQSAAKYFAHDLKLQDALKSIGRRGLLTATLFYKAEPDDRVGFGCLFAKESGVEPLGVLFNNEIFPHARGPHRSETWIFGESALLLSDKEILNEIDRARTQWILTHSRATTQTLYASTITRWPSALPRYDIGHEKALRVISETSSRSQFFGTAFGQIGLSRVLEGAVLRAREFEQRTSL